MECRLSEPDVPDVPPPGGTAFLLAFFGMGCLWGSFSCSLLWSCAGTPRGGRRGGGGGGADR